MPFTLKDLEDPLFLGLPVSEQLKGRQEIYDTLNKDPMFLQLPKAERLKILKVDSAGAFAANQARMGVPEAETRTEMGGLHAPMPKTGSTPFEMVRGAADAMLLNDPIMSAAVIPAAGMSSALRAGMAFGAFGAERGATEALNRDESLKDVAKSAVGTGIREGLFGAFLPPALRPASTITRGIVTPLAIGGGVGFVTAPPGERLQGALEGAATFGAFKLGARGVGLAAQGVRGTGKAVKDLFSRAERTGPDAPAGLADEVFGPGSLRTALDDLQSLVKTQRTGAADEMSQFERFYEGKLPPKEMVDINVRRSALEAERYLAEKNRMTPPLPPLSEDAADLLSRLYNLHETPTVAQRNTLRKLAQNKAVPQEIKEEALRILGESPATFEVPRPPETARPVLPPKTSEPIEIPTLPRLTKSTETATERQADVGDIFSMVMQNVGKGGMKVPQGLKPEVGRLTKNGLSPAVWNNKTGKEFDVVASELGMDSNQLIDSLRQRAQTGKVVPLTKAQTAEGDMLSAIRGETNPSNLVQVLTEIKDPNSDMAKAAVRRLKEIGVNVDLPDTVHIDQVGDDTLKLVLGNQTWFGKGPTYSKDQIQTAEKIAKQMRPNADPLDDLNKANESGAIRAVAGDDIIVGPRGGAPIGGPGNSPTNSTSDDMTRYFERLGKQGESFRNVELKNLMDAATRRTMAVQELARKFPEIKPIYEPFHAYPREAANKLDQIVTPLFEQKGPLGEDLATYFTIPDIQRTAIEKLATQHKVNRQGQPRMTATELQHARGFTPDMQRVFNDVLDYGKNILQTYRSWYVDRGTPALVKSGMSEPAARATLEAQAAKALQGLDHWVPSYRRGDKVAVAIDATTGKTLDYRLEPNIKSRVAAVEDMKAKYPGAIIKEDVVDNFVRSKGFDEIDLASLEILSRFARVDPTISQEFMTQLRPALLQKSDALAHFKKFENIPGFKEDLREGLIRSGMAATTYVERQKAKTAATEALAKIDSREQRELYRFAEQYIDENMKPGNKKLQAIRDGTYAYNLGMSLKQYGLQLTTFPVNVLPRLAQFGSLAEVKSVAGTGIRWAFSRNLKKAPAELQDAWHEAFKQGAFQPRAEAFSGGLGKVGEKIRGELPFQESRIEQKIADQLQSFETRGIRNLQKARDFLMAPITIADTQTRFAAFTSFYELGRKFKGMNQADAIKFGVEEANRTNGLYGRAESAQLFGRGDMALFANMFKSWTANQLSFWRGLYGEANQEARQSLSARGVQAPGLGQRLGEMGKAIGRPSSARALAGSVVGGIMALGGVLYNIPAPLRIALSQGLGVDPETEMRNLLSGQLGLPDMATEVVLRGVGALAGVDMSRSLAMGDTIPTSIADVIGPTPAMIQSLALGAGKLAQTATQPFGPDPMDALEGMMGGGLKNILKATRMGAEGLSTRQGGQLPGSENLRGIDPALQLMGFTPLSAAKTQALHRTSQIELQRHRDQQSNMMERYARAIVNQDEEAVKGIAERIQAQNEKAEEQGRPDLMITVSRPALRQRVAEMLAPGAALKRAPKNARARLLELQELYLGPPEIPE